MTISLSGELGPLTVPHLFLGLKAGKKTGTAVFENGTATKKAYVQGGEAVFAASNAEEDRLGECLMREGKITKAQFDASWEIMQKTGKKQGAVLVELKFITPQDLIAGVNLQVKHILLTLFTLKSGRYQFDDGPLPKADIIPLKMSIGNIILQGINRTDWKEVRKSLPALNTVLKPSTDPWVLFQAADLTHDQHAVLSLIDGKRSIEEICAQAGSGDYNALLSVHLLLALKMAEVGELKTEREMAAARAAVEEIVTPTQKPEAAPAAPPSEMKLTIQKAFEELEGKTHYQLLGVDESASAGEVKKAYFRLAKLYHPDRHFEPEMQDMKAALETLFWKTTEAYNTLSDQAKRDEYNLARAKSGQKIEPVEEKIDKAGNAAVQFNTGVQEYKRSNFWGAFEAFRWAARLDPGNPKYHFHQGLAVARMPRRSNEAEESFKKAIELDPSNAAYYLELGNLYLKGGLKPKAIDVFLEGLNWNPDSEKIKSALRAAGGAAEEPGKGKGGVFNRLFGGKK